MSLTPRLDRIEKNIVINGNFDLWQRGISSGAAGYLADRFTLSTGNTSVTRTVSRSTDVPAGTDALHSLLYTVNSPDASVAANEWEEILYNVEGYDFAPLYGKAMTLIFWVKASIAGQYSVFFRNGNNDRSYVAPYTISAPNTWERKVISLTHDTTGTWFKDNQRGMFMGWVLAEGTDFQTGTPNTWVATNRGSTSSNVRVIGTGSATFQLAQVMLVSGSFDTTTAPDFTRAGKNIGEEIAFCQRYYEKSYDLGVNPGTNTLLGMKGAIAQGTQRLGPGVQFLVSKRATPTVVLYSQAGTINKATSLGGGDVAGVVSTSGENGHGGSISITSDAAAFADGGFYYYHYTSDAEY